MFDSIGWPEIFAIVVIGIIIVGPEKMPRVIEDVRAAIFAARKAINNAKAELNGEFGEDFDEFKKPLSQIANIQRMGPRGVLSKALFDGDEEFMESFSPNKLLGDENPGTTQGTARPARASETGTPQPARPTFNYAEIYSDNKKKQQPAQPEQPPDGGSYKDIT